MSQKEFLMAGNMEINGLKIKLADVTVWKKALTIKSKCSMKTFRI